MTREEAIFNFGNISGTDDFEDEVMMNGLIHAIYNDFESRTCENCKHRKEMLYCDVLYVDTDEIENLWVDKDFGCNKFVSTDTKGE